MCQLDPGGVPWRRNDICAECIFHGEGSLEQRPKPVLVTLVAMPFFTSFLLLVLMASNLVASSY